MSTQREHATSVPNIQSAVCDALAVVSEQELGSGVSSIQGKYVLIIKYISIFWGWGVGVGGGGG